MYVVSCTTHNLNHICYSHQDPSPPTHLVTTSVVPVKDGAGDPSKNDLKELRVYPSAN